MNNVLISDPIFQLARGSPVWSFTLPFLTMGLVLYAALPLTSSILWPMRKEMKDKDQDGQGHGIPESEAEDVVFSPTEIKEGGRKEGFMAFLRIPSILIFYLTVMVGSICLGFITCETLHTPNISVSLLNLTHTYPHLWYALIPFRHVGTTRSAG